MAIKQDFGGEVLATKNRRFISADIRTSLTSPPPSRTHGYEVEGVDMITELTTSSVARLADFRNLPKQMNCKNRQIIFYNDSDSEHCSHTSRKVHRAA